MQQRHVINRVCSVVGAGALAVVVAACGPAAATGPHAPSAAAPVAVTRGACTVVDGRADRRCTPGVRNPRVTQLNIASTVCKSGWTATVRPPASYTNRLKDSQKAGYGEGGVPDSQLEEDHLIPLELGGNPTDPNNLWPEPRTGPRPAKVKDPAETGLKAAVCNRRLTLAGAQDQILRDWTH